jgi:hypothetical protein
MSGRHPLQKRKPTISGQSFGVPGNRFENVKHAEGDGVKPIPTPVKRRKPSHPEGSRGVRAPWFEGGFLPLFYIRGWPNKEARPLTC